MTIRRLRAQFTRLVLVAAMVVAIAAGDVAVGPQYEAAAMPRECASLREMQWEAAFWANYYGTFDFRYPKDFKPTLGQVYRLAAEAYQDAYDAAGC